MVSFIQAIVNSTVVVHKWQTGTMPAPALYHSHLYCAMEWGGFRLPLILEAITGEVPLKKVVPETISLTLAGECSPDTTCIYCNGLLRLQPLPIVKGE